MSKTYFAKRSDMYHYAASADYDGEYIRSANSHIEGGDVLSYTTKVAMFDKDKEMLLYTGHHYSNTTTNSLYELRRAFDHYKLLEVYDFTVNDAWDRLKEEYADHSKHPATRKEDKQYFIKCVDSLVNLVEYEGKNCKHLTTTIFLNAEQLAKDYQKQITEKENRAYERRQERIRKEQEEHQKRIDATEAICKEYDPAFNKEPTTFRECMSNTSCFIPETWLKEHHPELFNKVDNNYSLGDLYLSRHWDSEKRSYGDYYVYKRNRKDYKLLRKIHRYGGDWEDSPDVLVYNNNKVLFTSQWVKVDDKEGHVKTLLGLFLKAIDDGKDVSFVYGKHCGPYEIRGYDYEDKFLRVGCHCFLLENLREVYKDMKGE